MAVIYLISPQDVKDRTPISGNIDEKLIKQSILACQDMFVQFIIGTSLLNELKTQVQGDTLTELNQTLLDTYIQPAMRYWVMGEIVRPISYRFMNVGVQQKDTEFSRSVSSKEIAELETHYKNRAEFYAERTTLYLCENRDNYPLYDNPEDGIDVIKPSGNNYTTTLYLGGKKNEVSGIKNYRERRK